METQSLLHLIGAIYDAPLIGDWRPSLELVHAALDCAHVVLMAHDTKTGQHAPVGSRDPGIEISYVDQYMPLNDAWPLLASQNIGRPVLDRHVMSMRRYESSVFYNEFARPNGMVTSSGLVISREDGVVSAIWVNRGERSAELEQRDLDMLSLIRPHYQRAALLWQGRSALGGGDLSLWEAADRFSNGIMIVDRSGTILRTNRAASDFLRLQSKYLLERRPYAGPDAIRSGVLIELLRSLRSDQLSRAMGSYRFQAEDHVFLLTILPLQGAPDWAGTRRTCYVVLVSDLTRPPVNARDALIATFGMTNAEAKLAVQLGGEGKLGDIAACLGVQLSTVKTLLNRALLKTGTHSQSQLIRLVERLSLVGRDAP